MYNIPVPLSMGLTSPTVNYGKMKNTGWEFELGHGKNIGGFRYNASVNFSVFKNKVLDILAPSYGTLIVQKGIPYDSFYLVQMEGIFQNQKEIDEAPKHPFNPKPGDLKFKDANTIEKRLVIRPVDKKNTIF